MTRHFWVLLHRYAGLAMTLFLVIVGLTGSVLAFYHELDRWLNPELLTVAVREAPMLDPFTLHDRAEALEPRARVDQIFLRQVPGEAYSAFLQPRINPATSKAYELPADETLLDPYSGDKLGERTFGEVSLARANILSFLYRLHYSLALPASTGGLGATILGVVALVWTLDCFIGFYLSLPRWRRDSTVGNMNKRSWLARWRPAWLVKWRRLNFDLHRAGGLWVWPMLFVLAWSSVALNLNQVYTPVMKLVFDMREPMNDMPKLEKPLESPTLGWREAYARGRELLAEAGAKYGFSIASEQALFLDRVHGVYFYMARSSDDWSKDGGTHVAFDADTGELKSLSGPGVDTAGPVISRWLYWLHMAQVFGLPMQIFVCVMGILIVMLSMTGVIIWLRKRRARRVHAQRKAVQRVLAEKSQPDDAAEGLTT